MASDVVSSTRMAEFNRVEIALLSRFAEKGEGGTGNGGSP